MRLAYIALVLLVLTGHATAQVERDSRCLSSVGAKKIQLEWQTYSDAQAGWFGGYVRYRGASKSIPIVLANTETLSRPAGRPWEFRYTWLEVSGGSVTGEYQLSSQGANVYGFSYKSRRTGERFLFPEVSSPTEQDKCKWE